MLKLSINVKISFLIFCFAKLQIFLILANPYRLKVVNISWRKAETASFLESIAFISSE